VPISVKSVFLETVMVLVDISTVTTFCNPGGALAGKLIVAYIEPQVP